MASFSDIQRVVNGEGHFAPYNHITVTRIEGREAEGTLEVRPESLNPMGIVHGGALVALADFYGLSVDALICHEPRPRG